jgi:PAS domain S-box-containing protein
MKAGFNSYFKSFSKVSGLLGIVLLIWLICWGAAFPEDRTIPMPPERESIDLGPFIDILEDRSGTLSLLEAAGTEYARAYKPWKSESFNLGLTKSVFWFRLSIESGPRVSSQARIITLTPDVWWLDFGEALPGRVKAEVYIAGGKDTGFTWLKPNRLRLYKIDTTSGGRHSYYIRATSDTSLILYPKVYTTDHFLHGHTNRFIWLGLFYGLVVVVCIYHFFAYISMADKSYLWYALHLLLLILYFLGINGIIGQYILIGRFELVGTISRTFLGLVIFLGGLFTRSFLMTRDNAPKLDILILLGSLPGLIVAVFNPILPARLVNSSLILGGLFFPVITMIVGLVLLRRGFKPARYFVLAWTAFLVGGVVMALTFSGTIQYSALRLHGLQIGTALAAILFSIAFNDRIRLLRLEKDRLLKRESRISMILDSIRSGVLLADPQTGVILEVNHEAARIIGGDKEVIAGKVRHDDIFTETVVSAIREKNSHDRQGIETRLTTLGGKSVPVIISGKTIMLDGKAYILESLIDITRRKKLEEEREQLIDELQATLAEVKTLQGFLPICSNCKKVRDDEGYWQQIDQYIQDHSDAEFSHGICPECMKEMYPDVADTVLKRLEKKDGGDRLDN